MTISVREDHKILKYLILLVIDLWYFLGFSYSSAGKLDFGFYIQTGLDLFIDNVSSWLVSMKR